MNFSDFTEIATNARLLKIPRRVRISFERCSRQHLPPGSRSANAINIACAIKTIDARERTDLTKSRREMHPGRKAREEGEREEVEELGVYLHKT